MDQFVTVRIVQANAMDLTRFQFDFDLTFAAFFMNADGTIYGRFGSRSDAREGERDITMPGFSKAMIKALELHGDYPKNKRDLLGKQPTPTRITKPEQYPSLKQYKSKLDYGGEVVKSCLHCHQIRDAAREVYKAKGQALPSKEMYPYPMPDTVGMSLDPQAMAKVAKVLSGSPAGRSGIKAGDVIKMFDGQPMLSIADVQWVLHHAKDVDRIPVVVDRNGRQVKVTLSLPKDWRKKSDISWRVSTWRLRRDNFGGMYPVDMTDEQRKHEGLSTTAMALRLKHVGQYGKHAVAKRAGFKKDDIIVGFGGLTKRMSETQLHAFVMSKHKPGSRLSVSVRRGGRLTKLSLVLPKW
jgi:serine protease Do